MGTILPGTIPGGTGLGSCCSSSRAFIFHFCRQFAQLLFWFACKFGGGLFPPQQAVPCRGYEHRPSLHDHIQPNCQPYSAFFLASFWWQNTRKKGGHLLPCWVSSQSLLTLLSWCFSGANVAGKHRATFVHLHQRVLGSRGKPGSLQARNES